MSKNDQKTIQDKMTELTELSAWFQSDDFQIEQATEKFKEAQQLADEIERDLSEVKNDIVVLKQKFDQ